MIMKAYAGDTESPGAHRQEQGGTGMTEAGIGQALAAVLERPEVAAG
ncbi:hypothetical protein BEI_1821 [Halomonas beimenensis]|uniref:Uncharacterized protein n=1 Tax=Halomonas beimenensis TaxID=475662 RepID=A0A291P7G2_9GAMM|nr:hypothetical protein BEI_1821 [Halomonas beimenensis]